MKLLTYPDREMMMMDLADLLAGELNSHLMTGGRATLAVPGGTTPGPVFDTLSGVDLNWSDVTVMLTDERWVSEDSPRSNTALVRARLLTDRAAAAAFLPFYRADTTPEEAAAALSQDLAPLLPITVLLLGMGADMHTASLFLGAPTLAEALDEDAPPVMAVDGPDPDERRLTLTAPVLAGAMSIHVVVTGAEKRAALDRAAGIDDPARAPVCAVLDQATIHWAE